MKDYLTMMAFFILCTSFGCGAQENFQSSDSLNDNRKNVVRQMLTSFQSGDTSAFIHLNDQKYIQHNLQVADGKAGFKAFFARVPYHETKVNIVRLFQDDEYVFAHTDYDFFGRSVGFDIFRFEDGKIVEHWDNLQENKLSLNLGGRSPIDGEIIIKDTAKTASNKLLVRNFVEEVLIQRQFDRFHSYFLRDQSIHHDPAIANNLSAWLASLSESEKEGAAIQYKRAHMVLGEGNFVLVVSEGFIGQISSSFYDLYRVEQDRIVEHWNTIESIPNPEQWKNSNGKF